MNKISEGAIKLQSIDQTKLDWINYMTSLILFFALGSIALNFLSTLLMSKPISLAIINFIALQ